MGPNLTNDGSNTQTVETQCSASVKSFSECKYAISLLALPEMYIVLVHLGCEQITVEKVKKEANNTQGPTLKTGT